jgi:mono/diheme cytochrome c family protein
MSQINPDENPRAPYERPTAIPANGPDEEEDLRLQTRNLALLSWVFRSVVAVLIVVGALLYFGVETPPGEMRVQLADSTGYATPPKTTFATQLSGRVPRQGLERVLPNAPGREVPAMAAALTSPFATGAPTVKNGADVYAINCAFCHGVAGKGDGQVSESYTPRAPDLTTMAVQALTPGTLFYNVTNGIVSTPLPETKKYLPRDWHSFKGTISESDRWAVVAFVKSLRSPEAARLVQEAAATDPRVHGSIQKTPEAGK